MPAILSSTDELTKIILEQDIRDWNSLLEFVQYLPYGRNANREDLSLVIKEAKGTCSSKHALLKRVAELNGIDNVTLILGIYKMTGTNTPGIGDELLKNNIDYIPEAHCYLKLYGQKTDLTTPHSDISSIAGDLLAEIEIRPEQVGAFKINYHKDFLKGWLPSSGLSLSFDELWAIREQCIANLAG